MTMGIKKADLLFMKLEYMVLSIKMPKSTRIWGKIAFGEKLFCEGPDRIGLSK